MKNLKPGNKTVAVEEKIQLIVKNEVLTVVEKEAYGICDEGPVLNTLLIADLALSRRELEILR
ncbi:MAG: hypothetical protein ABIT58_00470 [Ferruginibacter sp.]